MSFPLGRDARRAPESDQTGKTTSEPNAPVTPTGLLQKAADHQAARGRIYEKPDGERSMARVARAFNALTGRDEAGTGISEAEAWLIQQCLKDVRLFTIPGYHADSAEDCVSYAALKGEAKAREAGKCS